jgi:predicted  nucleic acid-binding Zn-ribbon protein
MDQVANILVMVAAMCVILHVGSNFLEKKRLAEAEKKRLAEAEAEAEKKKLADAERKFADAERKLAEAERKLAEVEANKQKLTDVVFDKKKPTETSNKAVPIEKKGPYELVSSSGIKFSDLGEQSNKGKSKIKIPDGRLYDLNMTAVCRYVHGRNGCDASKNPESKCSGRLMEPGTQVLLDGVPLFEVILEGSVTRLVPISSTKNISNSSSSSTNSMSTTPVKSTKPVSDASSTNSVGAADGKPNNTASNASSTNSGGAADRKPKNTTSNSSSTNSRGTANGKDKKLVANVPVKSTTQVSLVVVNSGGAAPVESNNLELTASSANSAVSAAPVESNNLELTASSTNSAVSAAPVERTTSAYNASSAKSGGAASVGSKNPKPEVCTCCYGKQKCECDNDDYYCDKCKSYCTY